MDPHVPARTRLGRLHDRLVQGTASVTAGGLMIVGLPLALDYVIRPGDTLSGIASRHGTSVGTIVKTNDLHRSGDQIVAGQTLRVPGADSRSARKPRARRVSPDARRIVRYTVRPGDTPSALAVRFHAWTAELVDRNGSVLRVGERIEIPVVVAAAAKARAQGKNNALGRTRAQAPAKTAQRAKAPKAEHRKQARHHKSKKSTQPAPRRTSHADPSRATVRQVITRTARRNGVDHNLALAVSWQEAGWQMHHTSSAGAIGAMQVMPATGKWMSDVLGQPLRLRDLQDNVTAGVALLNILQSQARTRTAVAGYYQGLAGVRKHGMYRDTKRYVANVMALKNRFDRGRYPA